MKASYRRYRAACAAMTFLVVLDLAASSQAQTFTVLYNFTGSSDGANPLAALIQDEAGNLYGTTVWRGSGNVGVVFELSTLGTETVLHSFSGTDGENPETPLVRDSAGNLYGTAFHGGSHNYGTVFKIDTAGNETTLHNFTGGASDGCEPNQGLVRDKAGNLYGTTMKCGAYGNGTVFKLDSGGKMSLLHSFAGPPSDGAWPQGGHLIRDTPGNLYGITTFGGSSSNSGMVYKLAPNGRLTALHRFAGGISDGCLPYGTVVMDKYANLYGTTWSCGAPGNGIVWKVSKDGRATILHGFAGGTSDGCTPYAGVVRDPYGNLYGTTLWCGDYNYGTVYKLSSKGALTVLHSFAGGDGADPYDEVLRTSSGELFGTTFYGGSTGYGTVWSYKP